jgi:hypothetical protein
MTAYRCYFLDALQRMLGHHDFHADDDAEAIAITKTLSLKCGARGYELWQGLRCVHQQALP